jgi:acetate kinase
MTPNKILVANIGSTSFKFRLIEMPSERVLAKGGVERIGSAASPWKAQIGSEPEQSGTTAQLSRSSRNCSADSANWLQSASSP